MIFDALALLITKATFIGVRLVVLYLLAASLGSAEFAPIAFGLTATEIIRFAADWGVDTLSLRRFSAPDKGEASLRFRSVVRIKAVTSLVALVVSTPLLLLAAGIASPLIAILLSLTAVTSLWLNLAVNWLQTQGRLRAASIYMGALGIVALGAQFVIHLLHWHITARFIALIFFEGVMVMVTLRLAFGCLSPLPKPYRLDTIGSWLRSATPIALATILALTYARFDQIYIRAFATMSVLGDYTLAARLVEPALFLMAALSSTIYYRASRAVQHDVDHIAIGSMAIRWAVGVFVATAIFSMILSITGYYVISLFFKDYSLSPYFLIIGLCALPFRCTNLCLTAFIQAFGAYRATLFINLANCCNILFLVLFLGHFFGYYGAAIAVVIGEMINTASQSIVLRKIYHSGRRPMQAPAS